MLHGEQRGDLVPGVLRVALPEGGHGGRVHVATPLQAAGEGVRSE